MWLRRGECRQSKCCAVKVAGLIKEGGLGREGRTCEISTREEVRILNVELVLKVCSEGRLEESGILNARAHRRVRLNLER